LGVGLRVILLKDRFEKAAMVSKNK
jgi:hypothetical protein